MSYIKAIVPKNDYRLEVQLDSGSSIILNLESRLHTMRFGLLSDEAFFKSATTDGLCIFWDDKIEISISEVFQMARK